MLSRIKFVIIRLKIYIGDRTIYQIIKSIYHVSCITRFVSVTHQNRNVLANSLNYFPLKTNASTALPNNITVFITGLNYHNMIIRLYLSILCPFVIRTITLTSHNLLGSGS